MIKIIVPFAVIIAIMVIKKIPKIGGDVRFALILGALAALLMGGVYNPRRMVTSWFFRPQQRIVHHMAHFLWRSVF